MKIIGITGKSGSGKSTLAQLISCKLKCERVDIDKIGHKATSDEKISKKLCEVFGNEILGKDLKIDRKKLGNIVFSNKEKMEILTNITWEYMEKALDEILEKKQDVIVLEWALLPICKYMNKCDVKIFIYSDDKERKTKVMQRDNISEEYFLKRDLNALDYSNYKFDYTFFNDYKIETMQEIIETIREGSEFFGE